MLQLKGKSVFEGIAVGTLKVIIHQTIDISAAKDFAPEAERQRFFSAREQTTTYLDTLYRRAIAGSVGGAEAEIFRMHRMMAEDLDFEDGVTAAIAEGHCAEYAVKQTGETLAAMFAAMDDEYMKARAADVEDVARQMLRNLKGLPSETVVIEEPCILASDDFSPSEIVKLDSAKLLGFITANGSANSHTAILARTLGIPAIVATGEQIPSDYDGKTVVIDCDRQQVLVDPPKREADRYIALAKQQAAKKEALTALIGKPNETLDGKSIDVFCNVGNSKDVPLVLKNDGGGIGLFRSEFLYLESRDYPTEEEQFRQYRATVEAMNPRPVVIRTMDIGADKQADYFRLDPEENPALGYRSLRICFDRPEIMETQLSALYRASAFGNLMVMIPMIISEKELDWVLDAAERVRKNLAERGVAFNPDMPIGIMIETPAAALISDVLAKKAAFFSIGTNDLTQYTLAIDRQNAKLEPLLDRHHPALLRLIEMTVTNAHKEGKWVGICGELARDLDLTEFFLKIGVDELSVSPAYVLPLREKIRSLNLKKRVKGA